MSRYDYMRLPINIIPQDIIDKCHLTKEKKWLCCVWNPTRNVQTCTGRNYFKQPTHRETFKAWIPLLWSNTWSMEVWHESSDFLLNSLWIQCQICRERTFDTSIWCNALVQQNRHWLGRWYILWVNLGLVLQQTNHGHISDRVHTK